MADFLPGLTNAATFLTGRTTNLTALFGGGRAGLRRVTFRGAPFLVQDTSNEFGRRTVPHEFPKYDGGPYIEDMGRKARRFTLNGFVIGDDWEAQRDAVIIACEQPGSGTLNHPDYGEFTVYCETCSVTESKAGALRKADLSLSFVETGQNALVKLTQVNPLLRILSQIKRILGVIRDIATAAYVLAHLPGYIKSYLQTLLGYHLSATTRVKNTALKKALNVYQRTDVEDPRTFIPAAQNLVSAINADLLEHHLVERSGGVSPIKPGALAQRTANGAFTGASSLDTNATIITAYEALDSFGTIIAVPRPDVTATTPNKTIMRQSARVVDLLFKSTAAVCAVQASCFIDYQSRQEAEFVFTTVLGYLDEAAGIAAEDGYDALRDELLSLKALFVADVQDRAPQLHRSRFIDVPQPVPALVLAYREFNDASRASEIVARNHIVHPGFVQGDRIELVR